MYLQQKEDVWQVTLNRGRATVILAGQKTTENMKPRFMNQCAQDYRWENKCSGPHGKEELIFPSLEKIGSRGKLHALLLPAPSDHSREKPDCTARVDGWVDTAQVTLWLIHLGKHQGRGQHNQLHRLVQTHPRSELPPGFAVLQTPKEAAPPPLTARSLLWILQMPNINQKF